MSVMAEGRCRLGERGYSHCLSFELSRVQSLRQSLKLELAQA